MINVFIGYDQRQPLAYNVAAHSVATKCSKPVSITRLQLNQLPIKRRGLTEFTFSRFLVPYLCGYTGFGIFLDADVLCRGDVAELLQHPLGPSVSVVMHNKLFERPSVMVFNNDLCTGLTPAFIEGAGANPFNMTWAPIVGELPHEWNHLVGYDAPNPNAKLVHFTKGIPCWPETDQCEFAEEWKVCLRHMVDSVSHDSLMGNSVHVQPKAA